MNGLFNNSSYRTQFSFLIISFVLSLAVCSFFYLKWLQDNFIEAALESQANVISELISEDMAQLIFLSDPDTLAIIAFKLKKIETLRSARFYDLNNKPILKIDNSSDSIHYEKDQVEKIATNIKYDGVHIGYAKLNLFSHSLQEEKETTNQLYILFLLILISVGLLLAYTFDRRFMSRLTQLSSALQYVAQNKDFSKRLVEDQNDDIGKAKQYFNQLVALVEGQTEYLLYQANHDDLTGLYNRPRLMSRLNKMLKNRPKTGFHAVCYLDLDQFKVVNDTCGHTAGDELLKSLSEKLLKIVIDDDDASFGRLGGDEFIILMENKAKGEVHALIHQFQGAVDDFKFVFLEREFSIGISLGCIIFSNEDTSSSELFSAADSLCYQVKNTNRGDALVRYLHDEQLIDFQDQMDWVGRINKAIKTDQFRIYLQPIVDTANDEQDWNHFEALIRLHEDGKVVSPIHFSPVAERYGLTKKLDSWVIETVFKQISAHPNFLQSLELMSINLSVLSLVDQHFRERVKALFMQYDIPFEKICFEITETGVISEIDKAIEFIKQFRDLGVIFSLDDFGSGMSSFGYLKNLDVDILKIDGQFVKDICHDPVMKEMTAAMIKIGHVSHKKVIAEHVEDKQTVKLITEMGADYIQGYYYSKPLPIAEFMKNVGY